MSLQIIQQPNGRFAVWSTKTDSLLFWNVSEDELEGRIAEKLDAKLWCRDIIAKLKRGENPYFQFAVLWEEAKLTIPKEDRDKICKSPLHTTKVKNTMQSIVSEDGTARIKVSIDGRGTYFEIESIKEVHIVQNWPDRNIAVFTDEADAKLFEKIFQENRRDKTELKKCER